MVEKIRVCNKKIFCFFLAAAFSLTVATCTYDRAMAAEGIVEAETIEAIPLTWELIATIFTAMGIGTAAYWAGTDTDTREGIAGAIQEDIRDAHLLYQDVMEWPDQLQEIGSSVGTWIQGKVVDGKNYLSASLLNVFYEYAQSNDMLGGIVAGSVTYPSEPSFSAGTVISSSNLHVNTSAFLSALDAVTLTGYITYSKIQSIKSIIINNYNSDLYYLMLTNFAEGGTITNLEVYPVASLYGKTISSVNPTGNYSFQYFTNYIQMHQYRISSSGTVDDRGTHSLNVLYSGVYNPTLKTVTSNMSLDVGVARDIPMGENGQVFDNDGAIDYPWPSGAEQLIDGEASYPVSLPADVATDVISSNPALVDSTAPVVLPDVNVDVDHTIPSDTTQTETQEGTYDIPREMPTDNGLQPNYKNFLLPSWIKSKFPFCIPWDLALVGQQFQSAGSQAPVFKYTLNFDIDGGQDHDIIIDMSRFDRVMEIVRMGEFVLFLLGLMFATRKLLRG